MRLLIDLFACQTNSRFRGIGRYTRSLAKDLVRLRDANQVFALANSFYPESFEELRQEFTRLLSRGAFLPYSYEELNPSEGENSPYFEVASALLRHAYEVLNPDMVLYPSIFEGWGEKGIVPLPRNGFPGALRSVIVYDFIPYIFPNRFFDPDPYFKQFYLRRLNTLKQFDLLLAISESTRQDAIRFLNISPDKVVNILAAASPVFRKKTYSKEQIESLLSRFGITKSFVFYTGNVEFHKNIEMALRAFAQLPGEVRHTHQFVLTHTGEEIEFRSKIRSMGLEDHEVAITGHISDEELVDLYNCCKLFIFPSLYEGFGLPLLEAMSCGAPVIASNSSSIPEVMGREDALFDATNEASITKILFKSLTDNKFRKELSVYGLERAKNFSWEKSAQNAWQAIEETWEKSKEQRKLIFSLPVRQSKAHIAYMSPLPPQKSGIADYSAELLPFLSRHFDIDVFTETGTRVSDRTLLKNFRIYPWSRLLKHQGEYDAVVYQIGNSKFHQHAFQLLKEIPGVVVLHDFFLSHITEYIYTTGLSSGPQTGLLYDAGKFHGLSSMVDFMQRGIEKAIWDWPMNWNVLKYARELIVHSDYQNALIKTYYGKGWYPEPSVIKQLHRLEKHVSSEERLLRKKKLGLDPNSFVFSSFGFLNPMKLSFLIIQAFAKYISIDNQASLVFVGELDKGGEYEKRLLDLIGRSGISDHVKITGYVDNKSYQNYLLASDVAIQLRTNSRGETSRAVLDCMAHGIPTILNSHGTLNDYDGEDVIKLSEFPTTEELAQAMVNLRQDVDFRAKISQNAQNTIKEEFQPEQIAASYCEVITKAIQTSDRVLFAPLVNALVDGSKREEWLLSSSKYAAKNLSLRNQPKILIDVTNISYVDLRTGIQRVVKNLIRGLFSILDLSNHLELIRCSEGKLLRAARFTEGLFSLPEQSLGDEVVVSISPGDTLFMLDTSWNLYDQFIPFFNQIRQAGGRILTMVYDMIPVRFPEFCTAPTVEYFTKWIGKAISESDEIVCISRSVAEDVELYIRDDFDHHKRTCSITYIHLGANIPVVQEESGVREEVHNIISSSSSPLFLMVGTIEPRKGHAFALDAFEQIWEQGENFRLCIIGKVGWNVAETDRRIRNHIELGKRLFFIENATDAEINLFYSAGTALVIPSVAEGFGLPIVEAALHQLPVLASDIPVFREVGGEGTIYFSLQSPKYLVKAIEEMAERTPDERIALAKKVKCLTWKESAAWMLKILDNSPRRENTCLSSLEARQ